MPNIDDEDGLDHLDNYDVLRLRNQIDQARNNLETSMAHLEVPADWISARSNRNSEFRRVSIRLKQRYSSTSVEVSPEVLEEMQRILSKAEVDELETPSLFWVELLTPRSVGADFVINLAEVFENVWVPKYGQRRARTLFVVQGVYFVATFWIKAGLSIFDRLKPFFFG